MPTVNVDGVGVISFPDNMSQNDIQSAIEKDILPKQSQQAPQMSPFMSGVTGFNTGVERTAQGILQPLTESGLLGDAVANSSKNVANQREQDYQSAAKAHPLAAGIGSAAGSIASTAPMMAIPGMGETALARGLTQAAITGGLAGGSQYVNPGESRLLNTALGVGVGVPTFGVGRGLMAGNPFTKAATGAALGAAGGLAYGGGGYKDGGVGAMLGAAAPFIPGAAGNLVKSGFSKLTGKPANITTPFEQAAAMNVLKGVDPETAMANQQAAQRLDPRFNLTPAEASGNPLAAAQQGKLGKSPEGAQMMIDRGLERQGVQKDIINNFLNDISPSSAPAADDIRSISQNIIKQREQALQQKAKPYYDKAMQQEIDPNKFNQLIQHPKIAGAVQDVLTDPVYSDELSGFAPNSLKVLDMAKKRLDTEIGSNMPTFTNPGDKFRAGALTGIKNNLVSALDEVSPDYKIARQIYSDDAPAIQKLRDSKIAKFANLSDDQLKSVHRDVFDPSQTDTNLLANYRDEISKEDPDAWNRMVKGHLISQLNNSEATGSAFHSKFLKGDNQFNQLNTALANVPGASQKLLDMRNAFKNLVNPVTVKTAAGQAKSSTFTPDNRSTKESAIAAIQNLLGGQYDRAAVDLATSGQWDKGFQTIRNITDKNERAQKMALLLGNIAANRSVSTLKGN